MKKVVEDGTSSGPIVAASVEDPQSPEAAFVPFLKEPFKSVSDEEHRRNRMNRIVQDVRSGMMEEARKAIGQILSESCAEELGRASRRKLLRECKGNKEEFQKWLEAKKENARRAKQGLPPLKDGQASPKPSAKDKFKQLMLKRKGKLQEAAGKKELQEATGKGSGQKCSSCGADCGDGAVKVAGRAYCKECGRDVKLKRIQEAVRRIQEASAARRVDESGSFKNVFSQFVKFAEKDVSAAGARVRSVINRDLFNGVFSDGQGHGYVEGGSGKGLPNYAYDYALKFAKEWRGEEPGKVDESRDFSRELAILKRSYERHHGIREAADAPVGDVVVGVEVYGNLIDGKSETFQNAARRAEEKYGLKLTYDEGSSKAYFGLSLVDNPSLSVDQIEDKVDRSSAAFISDLETMGVDVSRFDSDVQTVAVRDGRASGSVGNLVVGVTVDGVTEDDAIFANLARLASERYGVSLFSDKENSRSVFGLSVIDDSSLSVDEAERKLEGKLAAFSSDADALGVRAGSEVQTVAIRD